MSSHSARAGGLKYQVVRDQIAQAIRGGEWQHGAQLPSERELAARYGVSYMTARRAVEELLESDLIERRGSNRTFVRHLGQLKAAGTTLNLIWTPSGNETLRTLLRLCQNEARARGFEPRLICWSSGSKRAALSAIADDFPTLIGLGFKDLHGPLLAAMKKAAPHLILLGNRLDEQGIPSVMADDARGMRLAISRLRALGHRNIGLLSNHERDPIDALRRATWNAELEGETLPSERERWLIHAPATSVAVTDATYKKLRQWLSSGCADVTALLCTNDHAAIAAIAACQDSGWPVPAKISILTFGNNPLFSFMRPSIAAVDVDLMRHAQIACELLANTNAIKPHLKLVQPRIIKGQTLDAAPA